MPDPRDVIEVLTYELNLLEQGGYGRLRQECATAVPFRGTMTCLNFGMPHRPHACHECLLYDFAPEEARVEDAPCQHIPLNESGDTIAKLLKQERFEDLEVALAQWLRSTIAQLESAKGACAT